jgi:hypothetical protein
MQHTNMKTEIITLTSDIYVACLAAKSFPEGVMESHDSLRDLMPFLPARKIFGISRPDKTGAILYKAAAEVLDKKELNISGLENVIIQQGEYLSIYIEDYRKDIPVIGVAFQKLISDPRIDPEGFCLEWYVTDIDLRCMVPMKHV